MGNPPKIVHIKKKEELARVTIRHHLSLLVVSRPMIFILGLCLHSSLCNIPALKRLNLTADDIIVIETRLNGITKASTRPAY